MHLFSPIFRKNIKTRRLCVVERKLHIIYLCIVTRCCVVHVQFRLMLVAGRFPGSDLHLYLALASESSPCWLSSPSACLIPSGLWNVCYRFCRQRRVGPFISLATLAFYFQHSMKNSRLFFVLNCLHLQNIVLYFLN